MVSMQGYLNAQSAAIARGEPYADSFGGGGYDDWDEPTPPKPIVKTPEMLQATPEWLTIGLQSYLDLRDEHGRVLPQWDEEPFEHLSGDIQSDESTASHEVTSDFLYIPPAAKVGKAALRGEVFVVQSSFSLGRKKSEGEPVIKPSFALSVLSVGGASKKNAIKASKQGGRVELQAEDLLEDADQKRSLITVESGIRKPKRDPRIAQPIVRVREGDEWTVPRHPGRAAGGLLKLLLARELDPRIKRVRIASAE
jgi:hypothetical protein